MYCRKRSKSNSPLWLAHSIIGKISPSHRSCAWRLQNSSSTSSRQSESLKISSFRISSLESILNSSLTLAKEVISESEICSTRSRVSETRSFTDFWTLSIRIKFLKKLYTLRHCLSWMAPLDCRQSVAKGARRNILSAQSFCF